MTVYTSTFNRLNIIYIFNTTHDMIHLIFLPLFIFAFVFFFLFAELESFVCIYVFASKWNALEKSTQFTGKLKTQLLCIPNSRILDNFGFFFSSSFSFILLSLHIFLFFYCCIVNNICVFIHILTVSKKRLHRYCAHNKLSEKWEPKNIDEQ